MSKLFACCRKDTDGSPVSCPLHVDTMNRRDTLIALAVLAATIQIDAVYAQAQEKIRRLAVLMGYSEDDVVARSRLAVFRDNLAALGWVEGRNLRIDVRFAGDVNRAPTLARELVALQPDVILSSTTGVTNALSDETKSIPIVFTVVADPIGCGYVKTLSRPEGNITGFVDLEPSLIEKWLELLKEIAPAVNRMAVVYNPDTSPYYGNFLLPVSAVARIVGVNAFPAPVRSEAEIQELIDGLARQPNGGLVVTTDGFMDANRKSIIAATARHKIPAIYSSSINIADGGLISYGVDITDLFRRAAPYVDRVLRGASAGNLPVQLPAKFELAVNRKTANALGLAIPLSVRLRADQVIE